MRLFYDRCMPAMKTRTESVLHITRRMQCTSFAMRRSMTAMLRFTRGMLVRTDELDARRGKLDASPRAIHRRTNSLHTTIGCMRR